MTREITLLSTVLIIAVGLWGCGTLTTRKATGTTNGGPSVAEAQMEAYNGPRARITVSRFTDSTAKGWYTLQIGNGMSEMLTTALFNTNRFIVLERQTLQDVLGEQDLGASGRVTRGTAAPVGDIEGAELLVTGAVTEFEPGSSGVRGGIIGGRGWGMLMGGVLAALHKSHIAIDLRIIDTRTSRIVAATSVEGGAMDFNLGGLLLGAGVGGSLGGYSKTPVEKAVRVALGEAVKFVASKTPAEYYHYNASGEPVATDATSHTSRSPEPTYNPISPLPK